MLTDFIPCGRFCAYAMDELLRALKICAVIQVYISKEHAVLAIFRQF